MATPKFTIVKKIENTALKLVKDTVFLLTLNSTFKTGAPANPAAGQLRKGVDTIRCTNLEDGKEVVVLANTTFRSAIEEEFPNGTYVGKSIQVKNIGMVNGKNYNKYEIAEIELAKK